MTVSLNEFLRRFLVHVLPKGLVRIRHFGLFANRRRGSMLVRRRALLGADDRATDPEITAQLRCPVCCGPMLFHQDWVVYAKPPFGGPERLRTVARLDRQTAKKRATARTAATSGFVG
jgi:hypothetical protein